MVPTTAPQYTVFAKQGYGVFDDSPEWGSASVLAAWSAYRAYGDVGELQREYPVMQRYVKFLESKAKDGIVAYGLGDWYDIGPGGPGFGKQTTLGVTATLMLYQDAMTMEKIAKLLDKPKMPRAMRRWHRRPGRRSMRASGTQSTGQYDKGSQTANAMPLELGLVPEARRAEVLAHIVADIHAHNDHVTTGEVGYPYMLRALMAAGRNDVVHGDDDAQRPAQLWVAARSRSDLADRGVGREPAQLAGPLHARRRGGVVLSRAGRNRFRSLARRRTSGLRFVLQSSTAWTG